MSQNDFGRYYQPLPGHQVEKPKQHQAGRRNDEKKIDAQHFGKQGKPHGGVKQRHQGLGKSNPGKMMRVPNAAGGGGNPMAVGGVENSPDEY